MTYDVPDAPTLAKYLDLLTRVLIAIRGSADEEAADLAYAVHNLPALLLRWRDRNEEEQLTAILRFERKYPKWGDHFSIALQSSRASEE